MRATLAIAILLLCGGNLLAQKHLPEIMLKGSIPIIKLGLPNLIHFYQISQATFEKEMGAHDYAVEPGYPSSFAKRTGDRMYVISKEKGTVGFICPAKSNMVDELERKLKPYISGVDAKLKEGAVPNADGSYNVADMEKNPGLGYNYKEKNHEYYITIRHMTFQGYEAVSVKLVEVVDRFHADQLIER